MLLEREVHSDVKALLLGTDMGNGKYAENPFQYAHLVKFERPAQLDSRTGKASTSSQRYVYLTDGSIDVTWDDGSKNLDGVNNGPQKYLANKLLDVSDVQESIEAKASNFTITLDGNGLGATVTATVTITNPATGEWDIVFPGNVDVVSAGFREGDKVVLSGGRSGNFNIVSFRANNTLRVKRVDESDTLTTGSATITMDLSSEEIKSLLMDKTNPNYVSFINREVFIYRAYFSDGTLVGAVPDGAGNRGPILLFKGIISAAEFEDSDSGIKIRWSLSSHWGDFSQVKGRVSSDGFHRALDHSGLPNPDATIKPIYAYDKGFIHAETSLNLLSTYSVQVEKQKVKAKNGFLGLGIGAKVKVKTYYVNEDRNTELDFQLAAKSIPVIYGVRNTGGIPIFADTKKNDSSEVYVVYALCEGQIGGLYDVYIEGRSLICNDAADSAARSQQTDDEVVEVICRGRADRGDVLSGTAATNIGTSPINYYDDAFTQDVFRFGNLFSYALNTHYRPYVPATNTAAANIGSGVNHGQTIKLTSPQEININFFSGTESQEADPQLVEISKANNFKVQSDYWERGDQLQADYWGPNHRLVDTAYVTVKFKIKEGETTIPEIQYVIRGKGINCYNYDYSYSPWAKATGESADNFPLGSTVSLYNSNGGALLNANVQIIDKWTLVRPDGTVETRFRWSEVPNLGYSNGIPSITKFYMSNGSQTWTMVTFNHKELSGTVEVMTGTTATVADSSGNTSVQLPTNSDLLVGGTTDQPSPALQLRNNDGTQLTHEVYRESLLVGTLSGSTLRTSLSYTNTRTDLV